MAPLSTMSKKVCKLCKKPGSPQAPLGKCGKCRITLYCHHACQLLDWGNHRKECGKPGQRRNMPQAVSRVNESGGSDNGPTSGTVLDTPIEMPFQHLKDERWLHGRSDTDTFKVLIDTYRLRVADEYTYGIQGQAHTIYGGARNACFGFHCFLDDVERKELMPTWWSSESRAACIRFGATNPTWGLWMALQPGDISNRYGDNLMTQQMRLFGEQVHGSPAEGMESGKELLDSYVSSELNATSQPAD